MNISPLDFLLGSIEVAIDGLEPSHVVMGVWHNMDVDRTSSLVVLGTERRIVSVVLTLIFGWIRMRETKQST